VNSRPVWSEGLFLRPQHFQAAERAAEAAVAARFEGGSVASYGLTMLDVPDDLRSGGQFQVARLTAILQDGEPVDIPATAPPPPLDVPADTRDAIVYLTLPARQPGATAFAAPGTAEAATARYLIAEHELIDIADPERNAELVELGTPNLRYGIEEADLAGRTKIGLKRIREVQGKKLIFDEAYIPPVLDIRASATLAAFLTDTLGRLEQRQDELALRSVDSLAGGSETFASFVLLQALNRWQPELKHLAHLERVHPERLFTAFLGLAGELATFSRAERRPPDFPRYDHDDLEACFRPLIEALREWLSRPLARSAVQLKLEQLGPGRYFSTIVDRGLYDQGRFYLAVSARRPLEQVRAQFPGLAKIGSVARMDRLESSALPGVPLAAVSAPPQQIRTLPNYVYFELDRTHSDWADFATAPALGLLVAGEWPDLALELWCVRSVR
jgi:type VI secretion system protein ImpJ